MQIKHQTAAATALMSSNVCVRERVFEYKAEKHMKHQTSTKERERVCVCVCLCAMHIKCQISVATALRSVQVIERELVCVFAALRSAHLCVGERECVCVRVCVCVCV